MPFKKEEISNKKNKKTIKSDFILRNKTKKFLKEIQDIG
jgi:hypothetical protein